MSLRARASVLDTYKVLSSALRAVGQLKKRTDCTYYWVNFGVILVENITNYMCSSCKHILIQVIDHKEEQRDEQN